MSQRMGDKKYQGNIHKKLFLSVIKDFDFVGKKVLDVGAGNGWCSVEFKRMGAEVKSIDLNPPNQEIIKMDIENIEFGSESFDFVNSHGTLHHCKHPHIAIQEIYRVLKPDGYLLVTGEATLLPTIFGYLNRYFLQYIILPFRDFEEWKNRGRMFFQKEYDMWCKKAGFSKIPKNLHYSCGVYQKHDEGLFPPLPTFIKVPFQSPNWTWWDFFNSLLADEYSKLQKRIQFLFPDKNVVLYDRGTSALYCALKSINSTRRNEVLTLSFTCDTVINSIVQAGCKPVYVDVDEEGNMDFADLKRKITRRTLAIIPVHQWGNLDDSIEEISKLCKKKKIYLIDDCANIGISWEYYDFDFKVLSFNMGKRYFGLGGGVLISPKKIKPPTVVNISAVFMRVWKIALKIKCKRLLTPFFNMLRALGIVSRQEDMTLTKFVPEPIKPLMLSDFQAGIANRVLDKDSDYMAHIHKLASVYHVHLYERKGIRLPKFADNYFTKFTIFVDDRYSLCKYLAKFGIETQWTFYPIHLQEGKTGLPHTEKLWKHTLSLPLSLNTSVKDVEFVCEKIKKWGKW